MTTINIYKPLHQSSSGSNLDLGVPLDHQGSLSVGNLVKWTRTHKLRGGPYSGIITMTVEASEGFGNSLQGIFDNWLGCRVEEGRSNEWFGLIRQMEYKKDGFTQRKSLDDAANRVAVYYTTEAGATGLTPFLDGVLDQRAYGIMERVIDIKGDLTLATQVRQAYLAQASTPLFDIVDVHPDDLDEELTIECVGPAYYFSQHYPNVQNMIVAGSDTPDQLIRDIVEEHPYIPLLGGRFEPNTVTVNETEPKLSALAYINALCDLGGANGEPWTFTIDKSIRFRYFPVPSRAQYKLEGGEFKYESGGATVNPRDVRPGVVRIPSAPRSLRSSDHWLESVGDVLIDEVTVTTDSDGNDVLRLGAPRGAYLVGAG